MEIRIGSIKKTEDDLKKINKNNVKLIIISSYDKDIESIKTEDKLVLNFDDITIKNQNAFNTMLAKRIHNFVDNIDFNKYKLYVCK